MHTIFGVPQERRASIFKVNSTENEENTLKSNDSCQKESTCTINMLRRRNVSENPKKASKYFIKILLHTKKDTMKINDKYQKQYMSAQLIYIGWRKI